MVDRNANPFSPVCDVRFTPRLDGECLDAVCYGVDDVLMAPWTGESETGGSDGEAIFSSIYHCQFLDKAINVAEAGYQLSVVSYTVDDTLIYMAASPDRQVRHARERRDRVEMPPRAESRPRPSQGMAP